MRPSTYAVLVLYKSDPPAVYKVILCGSEEVACHLATGYNEAGRFLAIATGTEQA